MKKFAARGVRSWASVAYFVLAWNAIGMVTYQYWQTKKSKAYDENWDKMSSSQKYLRLMSDEDDKVGVIKIHGTKVFSGNYEVADMKMSDFLKPKEQATEPEQVPKIDA